MTSSEIRQKFFDFFQEKNHKIVPSAPIVVKNDPTLMFTNAGMNQFKDYFLGTKTPDWKRIADTQKCLRVSGKHNDLEEVGRDSYHHTMFEMLGNWSFGDYFKKEAIEWAWELLTDRFGLDPERLFVSVFQGNKEENLEPDDEAASYWKQFVAEDKVLYFDKKDNFWEMGDTGPCGPCSEIHIDLRTEADREKIPGRLLVNQDHPEVIEIWNLVFIQYNRKADGSLETLPEKHVDTGMGFERLTMALQGKISSYDTDIFSPFIQYLEEQTGIQYTYSYQDDAMTDISMRVIADHLRAVSFTIADGELPSNMGAGYVIRRILRRAVRYGYSFLNQNEPFLNKMLPLIADQLGDVFPEIKAQKDFVQKVILEEEKSFLRTLEDGLKRLDHILVQNNTLEGELVFELYDTYGFPIDLTRLIASEKGWIIDEEGFSTALNVQKERSRADARRETGDWIVIRPAMTIEFAGYDKLEVKDAHILRYRTLKEKGKNIFQLVINKTPFYPEGGGQVGDTGILYAGEEVLQVLDTVRENDLIIHIVDKLPSHPEIPLRGKVDEVKRKKTEANHTATHLMHAALRQVLGNHVQQRGSLVKDDYFRFDFSHFQKMSDDEIRAVEKLVNEKIMENIIRKEDRNIPINEARKSGAMMLFGEKYGEEVRMITFDPSFSVELCGGCHVESTGKIGLFKIISESAIAAGVRRIEAISGMKAIEYLQNFEMEINKIKDLLKTPLPTPTPVIEQILHDNKVYKKELEKYKQTEAQSLKEQIKSSAIPHNGFQVIATRVNALDSKTAKTLAFNLGQEMENAVILFGLEEEGKPILQLYISQGLTHQLHAGKMIKELAKEINGGGGGQAFFATAGGNDASGLDRVFEKLKNLL